MSTPLVSIAMPFYNAERTMGASIRSILLQSHADWELLLCDDGSTDASRELARAFQIRASWCVATSAASNWERA